MAPLALPLLLAPLLVGAAYPVSTPQDTAEPLDLASAPSLALETFGRVSFVAPIVDEPSIQGITAFDIDDRGRFGVLRWIGEEEWRFELIDRDGVGRGSFVLPLPCAMDLDKWRLTWVSGERWLLTLNRRVGRAAAFWIDVERRSIGADSSWPCTHVQDIARSFHGGWLVSGSMGEGEDERAGLFSFDAGGKLLWSVPFGLAEDELRGAPSIACGANAIWVLQEGGRIAVLDEQGRHRRVLNPACARLSARLRALTGGRFLVSGQENTILDADGQPLASFELHLPDGSLYGFRSAQSAPDGSLWSYDAASESYPGGALYGFDESGLVVRTLGRALDPARLTAPDSVFVDSLGRILIPDYRTGVLHFFDREGRVLLRAQETLEDRARLFRIYWVAVRGDGALFEATNRGVLQFDATGARVGRERGHGQDHFLPGRMESWRTSGGDIQLIDDRGKRKLRTRRAPNGRWLSHVSALAVAPDGSPAVLDHGPSNDPGCWLHLYSATGEPLLSITLPVGDWYGLAFDGQRLVLRRGAELLVLRADGELVGRATLPAEPTDDWPIAFSPEGDELWVFASAAELWRFRLRE